MDQPSILSHEERAVAEALAGGSSPEAVAEQRDLDPDTVARTERRVREKTERALVTLAESPFAAAVAADADPELCSRVRDALDGT